MKIAKNDRRQNMGAKMAETKMVDFIKLYPPLIMSGGTDRKTNRGRIHCGL